MLAVDEQIVKDISPLKARFSEATWFDWLQDKSVQVLGVGGIGSWVTLCLARIGCRIYLNDMDSVEAVNMAGQLYKRSHIGLQKVAAIMDVCQDFADTTPMIGDGEFTQRTSIAAIIISAFDNMKGRKIAFEKWVEFIKTATLTDKNHFLFIDGRLLMEHYQVYAVTADEEQIAAYRETLCDDSEIVDLPCSMKSTTHCAMSIAGEIVGLLTNFAANVVTQEDEEINCKLRNLPFKIEKSIPLYQYEIDYGSSNNRGAGDLTGERSNN